MAKWLLSACTFSLAVVKVYPRTSLTNRLKSIFLTSIAEDAFMTTFSDRAVMFEKRREELVPLARRALGS